MQGHEPPVEFPYNLSPPTPLSSFFHQIVIKELDEKYSNGCIEDQD